jgi:hypothetical protein
MVYILGTAMPTILLIGGELHMVILAILLAAVPLAVLRSMQAAAQTGAAPSPLCDANSPEPAESTTGHPIGASALPLEILDSRSPLPTARGRGLRQRSRRARHRAAMVYGVAGALHAAIATTLLFVFNGIEFLPVRTVSV